MRKQDKLPYNVPSMIDIEALPWNGLNVVSTFSGAGGSCLGYRMAGFKVLWASEFIPAAQEVYKLNHPDSILDTRDIRQVQPEDILEAIGLEKGELDILDGSPPCASFSTAGKRSKGWGKVKKYSDTTQRVDDLFFEYARLLEGLQPKVFVAENVSGLIKGVAKGYFKEILQRLKDCGYKVRAKVLDAQWLGVPQMRQRLIFIGVRNDLGLEAVYPKPMKYNYSVAEALPWILNQAVANDKYEDASKRPALTVLQSTGRRKSSTLSGEALGYVEVNYTKLLPPSRQGKDGFNTIIINPNKPSGAVTISSPENDLAVPVPGSTEKRKFTIAELKRIMAFPDDFQLVGSYAQQWERLGRAVPPVMMAKIASKIKTGVLDKC